MNRNEYIEELKKRLKKLPFDEIKNAVEYYEEYFDEAGADNEAKAIDELGPPARTASQIIGNYTMKEMENPDKTVIKGWSLVWIILLAIFASPIALPIAFAIIAVVIALLVVLLSGIFSIAVAGVASVLSGMMAAVLSIMLVFSEPITTVFLLGIALFVFGIGLAFLIVAVHAAKLSFAGLAKLMSKFLLRRTVK